MVKGMAGRPEIMILLCVPGVCTSSVVTFSCLYVAHLDDAPLRQGQRMACSYMIGRLTSYMTGQQAHLTEHHIDAEVPIGGQSFHYI